jgi:large subunit ribosomal protein L3
MAGRMGSDTVSVKGLKVLAVDTTNNLLLVSGAIPGRRGTLIEVKATNA